MSEKESRILEFRDVVCRLPDDTGAAPLCLELSDGTVTGLVLDRPDAGGVLMDVAEGLVVPESGDTFFLGQNW